MAKVDWITWKTDSKEILNPNNIEEKINEEFQNYNTLMNSVVYEGIKHEITNGGLDKTSFNLMGISPSNESATNILNKIDEIKSITENLKREIKNSAEEQKQIEKKQLVTAIENKIEHEEEIKNSLTDPETISLYEERINILKDRLEVAKAL